MSWVSNYLSNTVVTGSSFADTINDYGYGSVTVIGGKGNDLITKHYNNYNGNLFLYNYGDGFDTISGFQSNDILQINGWSYSTMVSGNDFVVSVGLGSIVLQNAAYIPVNIVNQWGTLNTHYPSGVSYGTGYATVISNNNSNTVITGTTGNDALFNYGNNVEIYGGKGHDDIHNIGNNVFISGGNGADSIESYNSNYSFIAGDAGNDTLIAQGIGNTLDGGAHDDTIILDVNYNGNAINYYLGDGNDTVYGFNASDVLWIYDAAWSALRVNNDILVTLSGGSVTLKDVAGINPRIALNVTDNTTSGTIFEGTEIIDASTRKNAIKITCNELSNEIYGGAGNDSFYGGAGNDLIYGNAGNDKLYGEAGNDYIDGGTGNDTLSGGKGNDLFIYSAGKDVITDYENGDRISLGAAISKTTLNGSDVVFTLGKGSLTVKKGKGKTLNLIDSTGKKYSTVVGGTTLTLTNAAASSRTTAVKIVGNALANTINGGSKNDSLSGGAGNDSILGGAGNDKVFGEAGSDKLYGGAGNDSLWGGTGNDSLWGEKGNDLFIYEAGKDIIMDYAADDKISLGAAISKTTLSGSDVVFTLGKGSLTVKKGKGKTLNLIDSTGKKYSTVVGGTTLTLTNSAASPVTVDSSIKVINAFSRTTAIKITGNALANSIVGGSKKDTLYGGYGADTVSSGAGNDKLYGGKGDDILIGGAGNDSLWGGTGYDRRQRYNNGLHRRRYVENPQSGRLGGRLLHKSCLCKQQTHAHNQRRRFGYFYRRCQRRQVQYQRHELYNQRQDSQIKICTEKFFSRQRGGIFFAN